MAEIASMKVYEQNVVVERRPNGKKHGINEAQGINTEAIQKHEITEIELKW